MNRIFAGLSALGIFIFLCMGMGLWYFSTQLYNIALNPGYEEDINSKDRARVVSVNTEEIVLEPIKNTWGRFHIQAKYGLRGEEGYVWVSDLKNTTDDPKKVTRKIVGRRGTVNPGDILILNKDYVDGDPWTMHGISFEEIPLSGRLGIFPGMVYLRRKEDLDDCDPRLKKQSSYYT